MPTDPAIWINAAKLEEAQGNNDMVNGWLQRWRAMECIQGGHMQTLHHVPMVARTGSQPLQTNTRHPCLIPVTSGMHRFSQQQHCCSCHISYLNQGGCFMLTPM